MSGTIGNAGLSGLTGALGTFNTANSAANEFTGSMDQAEVQNQVQENAQQTLAQEALATEEGNAQTAEKEWIQTAGKT